MTDDGYVLLPALARMPGHLMWRAAARTRAVLAQSLPGTVEEHGYAALRALDDGAARSQQELSRATGVSRTTMTATAGALAAAGLVERVRNPADRRSYLLTRTAAGTRVAAGWGERGRLLDEELTEGWTTAERVELIGLLRRSAGEDLSADVVPDLLRSIGFLVTRTHAAMHPVFSEALEPLAIEPRHFGLLSILTAVGPVTQSELSRYIGVSGPTAVQMIDDLEARGLLERRRDPQDRRAHLLHLLPGAHGVLRAAQAIVARLEDERFAALSPAERETMITLLGRYVTSGASSTQR